MKVKMKAKEKGMVHIKAKIIIQLKTMEVLKLKRYN
jgi:hypothetical protein